MTRQHLNLRNEPIQWLRYWRTQFDGLGLTPDTFGRRIRHALPGGQAEGFAFDVGGNLVYQTNYNGMVITNQYDELNRLTNQSSVNGYQVSYAYDPATGQRVRTTDGSGVTAYGYDRRDRLVLKTVNWNQGPGVSLNYGYDANGNVTNLWSGTAGGVNLAYRYDLLGRLTNVLAGTNLAAGYGYDAVGNLQTAGYGNGVTNRYQYDVLNRLTNLTASTVSGTIARFYYQLGLTGNRTNLSESVNGIGRTYAWKYDALNRLTNETISTLGSVGYGYDAVGNRTNRASGISSLASGSSSYSANDWLTSDQYDANGNTTNSANVAYRYDVLNRLVDYNHGAVTLGYNGDGQRVVKNVGGAVTYYLVDDRNPSGYAQVLEEIAAYAGTTNLTKVYAYGLDLISQEQPGVATNYYGHDGHGSVRYLTDISGGITDTYTYDAYGNLIASSGSTANNYLYCGEQYDPQLKLYYNRARYLNPDTGRFWTMDTFVGDNEDPLSLHKYLYCQGNPVNGSDPLGHSFFGFDGTGNQSDEYCGGIWSPSNVSKMTFESTDPDRHYEIGVGTALGGWDLLGQGFGCRMENRIDTAMQELQADRAKGDMQMDVVGFSRGGVEATEFVNRVADTFPNETIRFVGLFDPVGSVGAPGCFAGYRTQLPARVQNSAEALAKDEDRAFFPETQVNAKAKQWFRGTHSDIGGGWSNHELSDWVLQWMIQQAQSCGVGINLSALKSMYGWVPNENGPINQNHGLMTLFPARRSIYGSYSLGDYFTQACIP
jgi:RHS repeat-associated protein